MPATRICCSRRGSLITQLHLLGLEEEETAGVAHQVLAGVVVHGDAEVHAVAS